MFLSAGTVQSVERLGAVLEYLHSARDQINIDCYIAIAFTHSECMKNCSAAVLLRSSVPSAVQC